MSNVRILVGDVLKRLGELPDKSVHCCVTSPPYWGLRNYGVDGQLGLEPTVDEFVEKLTAVFEEVRRVLRDDGTLWLNMGDCYSAAGWECSRRSVVGAGACPKEQRGRASYRRDRRPREDDPHKATPGLKNKDLVGQPWMLAFALRSAGWYLRSEIIWEKPNPMPESCRDRPTKSHEQIFLLTKKSKYFFDQEAVREAATTGSHPRNNTTPQRSSVPGATPHGSLRRAEGYPQEAGRNIRSVWKIATQSFPGAHFATFPEELPRKCILAGTSERGCCPDCGAPWARVVEKTRTFESGSGRSGNAPSGKNGPSLQGGGETGDIRRGPCVHSETIGWQPGCQCYHTVVLPEYPDDPSPADVDYIGGERRDLIAIWSRLPVVPATVLDPFGGAGTTALVAVKMGRDSILTELNPEYAEMAARRIEGECALLATVHLKKHK